MPSKSRGTGNLVSGNILNPNLSTGYVGIGSTYPEAKLDVDGNVKVSGIVSATSFVGLVTNSQTANYAEISGVSTVATKLQTPRTIQLTGDIFTYPQPFDGSQNLSIGSSISPNAVGLGTHTTGDYVKNITGTVGEITVSATYGEGSSPQISLPSNVTISNNLTVNNDLQVNNNLNVAGNLTIGGTSAYIISNDFRVKDADIVLGFTTDSYGNDVSNETTANHGGVSVASTLGSPLVSIYNPGVGETTPATYKKIMWFKSGSFTGLGTDAWLINYAVGIGSTQFPTGTRLAAGSVQFTENDLSVIRNINASGIVTSTGGFVGNLTGTATTATNLSNAANITTGTISASRLSGTYSINVSYATTAGISTVAQGLTGTPNINVGVVTATSFIGNLVGIASTATNLANAANITTGTISASRLSGFYDVNVSYATTSGISTTSQGLTGTPNLNVGVVTASSFVGNLVGIASTATNLANAANITTGTISASRLSGTYSINVSYATTAGISTTSTNVIGGIASVSSINVSGISTLGSVLVSSGIITAASGIVTYYGDGSKLSNTISGVSILSDISNLNEYIPYTVGIGTTTAFGINSSFVYNPSLGNLGIGSTTPTSKLDVVGNARISGILTASSFFGDGSGLTGVTAVGSGVEIRSNGSPIGVAATINFGSELTTVLSSGIATVTTPIYWVRTASGINTTSNVGIGTTNPSQNLHVQGNVRITGGLYDSNNNVGAAGSVLTSTGAGTSWSSPRSTSILHGTTTNIKRANTTYFSFGGTANATESIMSIALPATGTLSNLYIKLSAAAGAVGTGYTFTVRKNSAATSVVVTIAGTSTGGSDLVNSTSFTSGDLFSIEAKPSSTLPTDNLEVYWTARYVV